MSRCHRWSAPHRTTCKGHLPSLLAELSTGVRGGVRTRGSQTPSSQLCPPSPRWGALQQALRNLHGKTSKVVSPQLSETRLKGICESMVWCQFFLLGEEGKGRSPNAHAEIQSGSPSVLRQVSLRKDALWWGTWGSKHCRGLYHIDLNI